MRVEGGELSILQDSFLLGTGALDATENALETGSHGGESQVLPAKNEDKQGNQQSGLRSPNQKHTLVRDGVQGCGLNHDGGKRLGGNPSGLSPLISAQTCLENSSR